MVVGTNPRSGSKHDHVDHYQSNNTPCEDGCGGMVRVAMLERADSKEEEPSNAGGSAAGVDTTDVLDETGQEDTPPKGCPL